MGIDASSTTIGLCVLSYSDANIKLEHKEFFKPPKKGNIFERLFKIRQYIWSKLDEFNPDEVALEDIILYMRGKSTAHTTTLLSAVNRVIGITIFEWLGRPPYLYPVEFIRKTIKLADETPQKEDIPDLVASILKIEYPYFLNRIKNIAVENYDIADSIAVGLCYVKIEQGGLDHEQIKKPKSRKKKSKKKTAKKKTRKKRKTKK